MFKLSEICPDIARRMAAAQADQETHQAECTDDPCERCGRWPKRFVEAVDEWTRLAYGTIPEAYDGAALDADWLTKLVGHAAIERAKISLMARRVVFVGPPGAGKTTLAVAMFRARIEAERPRAGDAEKAYFSSLKRAAHVYMSSHELAKARVVHPLGEGEAPLVVEAMRCPLLLLDELGGEDPRHASAVAEVLYDRHASNLPTWVTMGVGPGEVAARYGGGIARRIFEGATVFRLARKP